MVTDLIGTTVRKILNKESAMYTVVYEWNGRRSAIYDIVLQWVKEEGRLPIETIKKFLIGDAEPKLSARFYYIRKD
jgi:hypothetical protein